MIKHFWWCGNITLRPAWWTSSADLLKCIFSSSTQHFIYITKSGGRQQQCVFRNTSDNADTNSRFETSDQFIKQLCLMCARKYKYCVGDHKTQLLFFSKHPPLSKLHIISSSKWLIILFTYNGPDSPSTMDNFIFSPTKSWDGG